MLSSVPSSNLFRFENSWLHNQTFLPSVLLAWHDAAFCSDSAGKLAACLKVTRAVSKAWSRRNRAPPPTYPKLQIYYRAN
jgi:hypothetical protein